MIAHATIIGRSHRLMQQNCQDFATSGPSAPGTTFGLVLDGCGSKYRDNNGTHPSHNEVGANLLGAYAAAFLNRNLAVSGQPLAVSNQQFVEDVVSQLYQACVTYLDCLVTLHPFQDENERRRFVATRLLCTMLGFVVTPETAVCFWSGDGYLVINDEIVPLDSENHPDYPAYQLLHGERNGRFNMLTIRSRPELTRLAVTSDGWQSEQLQQLDKPQKSLALHRWMNVQSRQRGSFEDDGAIAIYAITNKTNDR